MHNNSISDGDIPCAGGSAFIGQCITQLLAWDLTYFIAFAIVILVVSWLILFVITLKEDI